MQITAWKTQSSLRNVGGMWRDVPTWTKKERTGRRGCRRFVGIMMQRIDKARRTRGRIKPTTGLCPHAIWCPSTPPFFLSRTVSFPLSSMLERSSPFGGCPSPWSVTDPPSAIPLGILSSSQKSLITSLKKFFFSWTFPTLSSLLFWGKNSRKSVWKEKIYMHEKSAGKKENPWFGEVMSVIKG